MRFAAKVIRAMGLPLAVRAVLQRHRVTILVWHDPNAAVFRRHLRALAHAYAIVPLRDVATALEKRSFRELPRKPLVITLDDGHRGNAWLAPVLQETGIAVTIFVCTELIDSGGSFWFKHADVDALKRLSDAARVAELAASDRSGVVSRDALTPDEVRTLAPVAEFQSHTATHPILPLCTAEKAHREIVESKERLEEGYGVAVYAFAYPNGDYSDRDVDLVRSAGYAVAMTADPGFNSESADPLRLRRITVGDDDDISTLLLKASGIWSFFKWRLRPRPYGYRAEPGETRFETAGQT